MLVALTLSALVVLLAHRVFAAVTDGAQRLAEARAALDRQANARRLLTALVGDLDIGLPGSSGFNGRPSGVAFSTWIEDSNGWLERRRIGLGVDGGALTVRGLAGGPLVLADSVVQLDVDYLLDYGVVAPWVRTWQSPVSALAPQGQRYRSDGALLRHSSATARFRRASAYSGLISSARR